MVIFTWILCSLIFDIWYNMLPAFSWPPVQLTKSFYWRPYFSWIMKSVNFLNDLIMFFFSFQENDEINSRVFFIGPTVHEYAEHLLPSMTNMYYCMSTLMRPLMCFINNLPKMTTWVKCVMLRTWHIRQVMLSNMLLMSDYWHGEQTMLSYLIFIFPWRE